MNCSDPKKVTNSLLLRKSETKNGTAITQTRDNAEKILEISEILKSRDYGTRQISYILIKKHVQYSINQLINVFSQEKNLLRLERDMLTVVIINEMN